MSNIFNPVSTYRIQFNKDFTFSDLEKIIPYLEQLGVKTIYASPVFEATPGSTHGYDGTDPNAINPEIGTLEQLVSISNDLKNKNISWLQDIVPNHLSYHENTKWLMDVLEKGQESEFAPVFDIIWDHPDYPQRLMVPFPGSELERNLKETYPGEENYVLCSWQETDHRMNYRRFFLVNTLICTNVHDDNVFSLYHQLIKDLVEKNVFQGLRVDHIDGLYDPTRYLHDLRKLAGSAHYIVVEKILEHGEEMPEYWPIQGNSGYDFLAMVNNLLTNRAAEFDLTTFYYDITKNGVSVAGQVLDKKRMILQNYMGGELDNLTRLYRQVSDTPAAKISDEDLKNNITEYLVNCPVYRYYENIPMMKMDEGRDAKQLQRFYQRCMQFTGPLMAKGVEDTLMYTYNRFIGHNEVGDSPEYFGYTPEEFHELMQYRQKQWPLAMNASSTHDTKRGEDVRARLNALTSFHTEWTELVKVWQADNQHLKKNGYPDKNDEYFIYQTLAGSYPVYSPSGINPEDEKAYPTRLKEYLEKSLREAKVHSTWTEQNTEYEEAAINFAHALLDQRSVFFKSFLPFLKKITDYGMINSFVQLTLKFTCPGIPDIYQGTELWDLSLVDPDNRRPVDFRSRENMLTENLFWRELWATRWDGKIKFQLLRRLLKIRNQYNEVFSSGEYIPIAIAGSLKNNLFAFARKAKEKVIIVVVPLNYPDVTNKLEGEDLLSFDWQDTQIIFEDTNGCHDLLNDQPLRSNTDLFVNDLFQKFPIAVISK